MLQQVGGGNRIWARPFGWHADDIGLQGGAALLKGRARLFNFKTILILCLCLCFARIAI
jgi:hypothetical protein